MCNTSNHILKEPWYYFFQLVFMVSAISIYPVCAQPGGKAFQFLEVPNSARVAALGGDAVAVYDSDPDLSYHNPSLLNRSMHHHLALNYVNYFAGINYGYVAAAVRFGKKSTLAGGIHYLNYGKFEGADETGTLTGTFRAADYSVHAIYSLPVDSLLTLGFTVKSVFSDYELYNSTALAFDAGITYHNPGMNFTAGLVLRNIGFQVHTYYPGQARESLPFNIAIGITQRLKYAPLTFYIIADHLENWNLTYEVEDESDNNNEQIIDGSTSESGFDRFIDQFMRHIIIGTEFGIGKNLVLRGSYNYRRRQELKIDTRPGMVGFSFGAGIRINKFTISYARSVYHLAGGSNYFSLDVNLDEFNKKL